VPKILCEKIPEKRIRGEKRGSEGAQSSGENGETKNLGLGAGWDYPRRSRGITRRSEISLGRGMEVKNPGGAHGLEKTSCG